MQTYNQPLPLGGAGDGRPEAALLLRQRRGVRSALHSACDEMKMENAHSHGRRSHCYCCRNRRSCRSWHHMMSHRMCLSYNAPSSSLGESQEEDPVVYRCRSTGRCLRSMRFQWLLFLQSAVATLCPSMHTIHTYRWPP